MPNSAIRSELSRRQNQKEAVESETNIGNLSTGEALTKQNAEALTGGEATLAEVSHVG